MPAVISPFVARARSAPARRGTCSSPASGSTPRPRCGSASCTELADDLDAGVESVVADILAAGPKAVRLAKRLARGGLSAEESVQLLAELRAGDEAQEGITAFLERRPPAWSDQSG